MKKITLIALIIALIPASIVSAQAYEPLVGIPGIDPNTDFNSFISTLYALSISIAGLLAVIKIIIAGVKYMTTDLVPSKGNAKKDIEGALIGLLVVLSAVLILTVINPQLTDVDMSLSPAAQRPLATSNTPSAVAPQPTEDNAAYKAIKAADHSPEEKAAFINDCTSNNNSPYLNDGNDGLYRCYKTAGKNVIRTSFCEKIKVDANSNCNTEQASAKTKCESGNAQKPGKFTVDPLNNKFGICIQ